MSSGCRWRPCATCRCRCRTAGPCRSSQLASFDFDQEFPLIWRRDRVPTLTVQADVAPGNLPEAVVAHLAPQVEELNASLPAPYRIEVGGTVEESANSQASVIAVVPLMLLLMITFLMIQLQSFSMLALC